MCLKTHKGYILRRFAQTSAGTSSFPECVFAILRRDWRVPPTLRDYVRNLVRPHSVLLLVSSFILTLCSTPRFLGLADLVWLLSCAISFMNEIAKLYVEETEKKRKPRRKADKREKEGSKEE